MHSTRSAGSTPPKELTMKRIHKIIAGSAVALTLIAATSVYAAGPEGAGMCDHGGPGMGMMGGDHHGDMHARMMAMHGGHGGAQMGEQRLAQLKTELKLTAAQEPAWQAFSTKAKEQMAAMKDMQPQPPKADDAKLSAPERMDQHIAQMNKHLAGMQTMNAAVKDLYAALTPEQRSAADKHFSHMMAGGHRGGHHGGPMGGPGHGNSPMGGSGVPG
jgi:hypothetical protein